MESTGSMMTKIEKVAEGAEEQGERAMGRARAALGAIDTRTRELAAEHPMMVLLGAASIGYFVGRLIARR